jgi:hypothetical protein
MGSDFSSQLEMPRAFANGAKGWATRPLLSICHPERSRGTLRLALPTRRSMFRVPPLPARHQPGGGLQDGAPRRYVHQHSAIHDLSHGRPTEDRSRVPRGQGRINQFRKLKKAAVAVERGMARYKPDEGFGRALGLMARFVSSNVAYFSNWNPVAPGWTLNLQCMKRTFCRTTGPPP